MEGSISASDKLPLQDISNYTELVVADVASPSTDSRRKKPKLHEVPPPPRKQLISWTPEEDEVLRAAVAQHKSRNWKQIAAALPNRTDVQCLHRWQKVLNPVLVKGYWTKEEDDRMMELVAMFGTKRWAAIARSLPGRNGKQCRERWCNHLDPQIKKEAWSEAEDVMLFLAHQRYGNRWAEISKLLPGRSDNGIKNRWNTAVKKKVKELEEYCKIWNLQNPPDHDHEKQGANENEIHEERTSEELLALLASEDLLALSNQPCYIQDADDDKNAERNVRGQTNLSKFDFAL